MSGDRLSLAARGNRLGEVEDGGIVRCDACPVLCRIREGRLGACARYGNVAGKLVRTDPVVLMAKTVDAKGKLVAFASDD
jgi:6-hydroxynicotinate reductase